MALVVNTNIAAIDAAQSLSTTQTSLEKATQQLSSGLRINSAADDAAGLTISQSLTGQINGFAQAGRNTQDGVSLAQTAAGALTQVQQMLQRIRELAVQYGDGTLNATDQGAIQTEVNQLISEIDQIGSDTTFNGINVLDSAGTVTFQVGANDGDTIAMATVSLGTLISSITGSSGGGGSGSGPYELVGPHGEVVYGTEVYDPQTTNAADYLWYGGAGTPDATPPPAPAGVTSAELFGAYAGQDTNGEDGIGDWAWRSASPHREAQRPTRALRTCSVMGGRSRTSHRRAWHSAPRQR